MYTYPLRRDSQAVSTTKLAVGIIVVLVIVVFATLAMSNSGSGSLGGVFGPCSKTVTTNYVSTFTSYSTQNYNPNIVNGLITVDAGHYEYYQFSIPASTSGIASVHGSFTASGGSGNDIIVYIMDNTNFVNWQNGHSATSYYNSGQVTTANFNVNLNAGTYYLVYDNTFSIFSQKNVQTTASFSYSTVTPVPETSVGTSTYTTTC